MYARIMGKLNARRKGLLEEGEKGFTLIELLVVVIIIGILAAIAIPVYLGVQNNAKDSAVQSDVVNLKTAVVSQETNGGTLPGDDSTLADFKTGAWKTAGATASDNTTALSYKAGSGSAFCVAGLSSTGTYFYATDSAGAKKDASASQADMTAAGCTVPTAG